METWLVWGCLGRNRHGRLRFLDECMIARPDPGFSTPDFPDPGFSALLMVLPSLLVLFSWVQPF